MELPRCWGQARFQFLKNRNNPTLISASVAAGIRPALASRHEREHRADQNGENLPGWQDSVNESKWATRAALTMPMPRSRSVSRVSALRADSLFPYTETQVNHSPPGRGFFSWPQVSLHKRRLTSMSCEVRANPTHLRMIASAATPAAAARLWSGEGDSRSGGRCVNQNVADTRCGASLIPGRLRFLSFSCFAGRAAPNWITAFASLYRPATGSGHCGWHGWPTDSPRLSESAAEYLPPRYSAMPSDPAAPAKSRAIRAGRRHHCSPNSPSCRRASGMSHTAILPFDRLTAR